VSSSAGRTVLYACCLAFVTRWRKPLVIDKKEKREQALPASRQAPALHIIVPARLECVGLPPLFVGSLTKPRSGLTEERSDAGAEAGDPAEISHGRAG
jgi:hypothetical protein